ncbi:RpiR family transcriptional regulator [Erwinia typographi]|uniref:RpiR family transcriptional regulator n=1 Tax=Erwinia typographi TaxID=371042 RepID=A0A0A3Z515_9GAMM|nr:MurR/RpiR family transcriptional regulator [Erwinia typographi]KGT92859.1 RpiR family transcriptional regulator [Erwinia typographi]
MDLQTLNQLIKTRYDSLPKREQQAAAFVLEHPHEVAVMSMRELASMAELPASTMTRFAKSLGLTGFDQLRSVYISEIRGQGHAYESRMAGLVAMKQQVGDNSLALDLADTTVAHIQSLCTPQQIESIVRAGKILSAARRIYCLALRSSYPIAHHFAHVTSYFHRDVRLVDGSGESGIMTLLHDLSNKDVLFVTSISPYARKTISLTKYMSQHKVKIVAITDNASSPVARISDEAIVVKKQTNSFFDTLTPALLTTEILIALLAANTRGDVRSKVKNTEEKIWALGEWLKTT